jgi:selenide,water dikinase
MCRASGVRAEISFARVPFITDEVFALLQKDCIPGGTRDNLEEAEAIVEWNAVADPNKFLLADAQTSGGLLLAVPPRRLDQVLRILKKHRTPCAAVIGSVARSAKPKIRVTG